MELTPDAVVSSVECGHEEDLESNQHFLVTCDDFPDRDGDALILSVDATARYNHRTLASDEFSAIMVVRDGEANPVEQFIAVAGCPDGFAEFTDALIEVLDTPCGDFHVTANLVADAPNGTASVSDIKVVPV